MYTWTFNTLEALAFVPLITALFYVPVEFICAICIHKSRRKFLEKGNGLSEITWKQWIFLFSSLGIILISILLPICFSTSKTIIEIMASMSILFFPILWMTALFYFYKQSRQHYYLGPTSIRSIFQKYVLLHVLVVTVRIFLFFEMSYFLMIEAILSGIYLVIAGISLLMGPHKKEVAGTDDSQPTQEE